MKTGKFLLLFEQYIGELCDKREAVADSLKLTNFGICYDANMRNSNVNNITPLSSSVDVIQVSDYARAYEKKTGCGC